MNFRNFAQSGNRRPGMQLWGRFALISALLLAVAGLIGSTTEPALAGPAAAPNAQAGTVSLAVVSARTEANHPSGIPVTKGDPIGEYKYIINVDNTGNPLQGRNDGCHPDNAGYPESCDWPSVRQVPGAAPIILQGDQDDFNGVNASISLPDGKYLISVMAADYKIGGKHFTVSGGPVNIQVALHPHPLPPATMRIKVFEDISPVNGQMDAPAEGGLAGFHAVINDTAGEISADIFGNPLCTTYDAAGNITGKTDCLISDANGDIVVPNLGPLRYDVVVVPPQDGQGWVETTTLEGSPSWDTWLTEGGTGLDNEFVVAGEPFPLTIFGFTKPVNNLAGGTGGVKGTLVSASVFMPQTGALPYYGDIWNGFTGTKINGPIEDGWVALSDLQNGDTAVYVGRANSDGTYQIDGVPDGNYLFTWWDNNLHHILDWIQVTVADGQVYDMGTPMLTGWFTIFDGYVFDDVNLNGVKDPGESGLANYTLVYRDRDNSEIDRMSIAVTTDETGYYIFEKAYPMNSWMVVEAYNDRYYTTGITYQVENQPTASTFLGNGVDVGVMPVLGQRARIDWGVRPYDPTNLNYPATGRPRNGGIAGSVFYDTTRAEYDARYQGAEPWAPGIPALTMNLYATVRCGTNAGAVCDERGDYELADDGSYKKGALLNTTTTETWEQPTGCTGRDANGNVLEFGEGKDQYLFANPGPDGYRCLEAPVVGTQVQHGFATLDGNWGFGDGCLGAGNSALEEGVCAFGEPQPLPADDYLVEVEIPKDILGRNIYQVVREEDINVFDGDVYAQQAAVAIPPSACAGALHTVDVATTGSDNYPAKPYITPSGTITVPVSTPVINPNFAAEDGGGPFEGKIRPLCDTKLVTVSNGKSIAPTFTLFTEVPIPGKWKGLIIDDLTVSTNPMDIWYGEKPGIPNSPIGVYDFDNQLLTTLTSDPNGAYEVLLPSTYTVNAPTPSGVFAGMYYILGNDPGQPDAPNHNYNPQFRTIGATFEVYPGLMVPSDLAPTQIVPGVLAAGSQFGLPPQCSLNDPANPTTPELFAVSQPYANPGGTFVIEGQGFGGQAGQVTLDATLTLSATNWSDTRIDVTVPASTPPGAHQLAITDSSGENSTVNGLTFHVLGDGYNPPVFEVGAGKPYATIQDGIDAAANANGLVVIYPNLTEQWNPTGIYFENVAVYSPVKLQGIGPGGVYANNTAVLGSVIDGRGVAGDTGYATTWRTKIMSLTWDGTQAVYEGPVVYVLAENGEFTDGFKASIDGLRIQGGDQQGFPNNLTPADPGQKEFAAVQGGGVFANSYANYLQITNNVMESNGGAYASAIRVGTPNLPGDYKDNQNDFVTIANNRILANGGTNLAGAIGIFAGAEGYEVAHNDICGNYSAEYGGGISHYGYSPNGKIHDNRIYFNRSYDEGGGIMIAGELPANPAILSPGAGPVDVYNNLIQNNLSNDDGGGLRFLMAGNFPYNVYNNFIVNNISTHEGGGVALNDTPDVRFYNNTVMKNITTATAMTSNGQPAPTGLSTSANSNLLQATLPGDAPSFSNPLLFNNIFWDNRAGSFSGSTVAGIGLAGDPGTINHWDLGVADNTGLLSPTSSLLQVTNGTNSVAYDGDPILQNVVGQDPQVVATYDTSVTVAPWRGNPRFVDIMMVTTEGTANLMGDYHLRTSDSPAVNKGVYIKELVKTPKFDIDNDPRPRSLENAADMGADERSDGQMPPSTLLYFSTDGGGRNNPIPGVPDPYDDANIYTWDGEFFGREFVPRLAFTDATWPDRGVAQIDGLMVDTTVTTPTYYMSFGRRESIEVPQVGTVQDEDIIKVEYINSEYQFSMYFEGARCALDGNIGQNIDALDIQNGILYFSIAGDEMVGSILDGHRSDIFSWDGTQCDRVFSARGNSLLAANSNANFDGLTYVDADTFYVSFANNSLPNLVDAFAGQIQDEDIVLFDNNLWLLHFDGTDKGLDVTNGQDINAISVPAGVPMIVGQRAMVPGSSGATNGQIFLPIIIKNTP